MVTQYWPNPFAKGIDLFDAIKHWKVNGFYVLLHADTRAVGSQMQNVLMFI